MSHKILWPNRGGRGAGPREVDAALAECQVAARPAAGGAARVRREGKFLSLEGTTFRVRAATYGTFRPRRDGYLFPEPPVLERDLRAMAALGLNTVRTYTVPPPDLLAAVAENGLRLIASVYYRDWREEPSASRAARRRVLEAGRRALDEALQVCAGRPEVMALSIGNEVPADVVRLHGTQAVAEVLETLLDEVHGADPGLLATYANYPTTEYLRPAGQDLVCVNVFLEKPDRFRSYLQHLLVQAGDLPVVLTELGLAAGVHGERAQAESLAWQLRAVDEAGCAGATVFSWTDEWAVGGHEVEGWEFGITRRDRAPKPSAAVVEGWARRSLRDLRDDWPRISVVVPAYNAEAHIGNCLRSIQRCRYPNLEVIVCDDGSTDGTGRIAAGFPFRLLQLEHGGLSAARNQGIAAATGEIVAFLDADAMCHPDWPYHLALAFDGDPEVRGVGGPNLPVPGAAFEERAISLAPGNPVEVLLSDSRAEHVPGCNMAFHRSALAAIGGFDQVYTAAGDDVDVCWKLLDRGDQIAYAPAAQVFHHRRSTLGGFLRQQIGYGKAERIVYQRHRHRFNRLGQARWRGFIYGYPSILPGLLRPIVYHGPLGLAPFQGVVRRPGEVLASYLSAWLPALSLLGLVELPPAALAGWWLPLLLWPLLLAAYAGAVALAIRPGPHEPRPVALRLLVGTLFIVQPIARAWGRLRGPVLEPPPATPPPTWSGDRAAWLFELERALLKRRCGIKAGASDADWDFQAWVGPLVTCRLTTAVAWGWRPLWRMRYRPRSWTVLVLLAGLVLTLKVLLLGLAVLTLTAAMASFELWLLRRLLGNAVAETTSGAT